MSKQQNSNWCHFLTFIAGTILIIAFASTTIADTPNFTRIMTGPHVTDGGASYGVSWIDYDNDGWLDIYVGSSSTSENNFLYHNEGDGSFTKITSDPIANVMSRSYSHAWGDYDNDGDEDVYVGRHNYSTNNFYANNGDGTFTQVDTAGDLTTDVACSNTHAWIDIDNDGDLDLYSQNETTSKPWSAANAMYRNDNGIFVKITTGEIVTDVNNAHGMSWSDYDNDGDMDLFVANTYFEYPLPDPADYMYKNCYYRNDGGFNFTKIVSGPVVTNLSISFAPSLGDYDNDGDQDLFVANGAMDLQNFLYSNNGDGSFTRITTAGEMVTNEASNLGSSWVDYDNDGDLDLYVTTWADNLPNELYENNGDGTFTRNMTGPLVNDVVGNFGPAWGDYDRDGDLDVFITRYHNDNLLYRNDGNGNSWLNVKCIGTISNASAIGAKVRIKANISGNPVWQLREISPAASYCMHHALNAHFGLGDASIIDTIRVEWPSGLVDTISDISPNQYLSITEKDYHDTDEDGVINLNDNCPMTYNPGQEDIDLDQVGDLCDNCGENWNPEQIDADGDSIGDVCDNCPNDYNTGQEDADGDNIGDACDYICGDANNDNNINILDIVYIINYKYKSGLAPDPLESADVNHDEAINILDVVYLINYKYKSGPDPECVTDLP